MDLGRYELGRLECPISHKDGGCGAGLAQRQLWGFHPVVSAHGLHVPPGWQVHQLLPHEGRPQVQYPVKRALHQTQSLRDQGESKFEGLEGTRLTGASHARRMGACQTVSFVTLL